MFGIGGFAVKAARKGLQDAIKFEFTSNTIQFLRLLSNQASQSGLNHEVLKLHRETSHYLELFASEIKAEQYWEELVASIIITGSGGPPVAKQAVAARLALEALYATHPTFTIGFLYFRVSILSFRLEFKYAEAIGVCSEAMAFLDSHPQFDSPYFPAEFALQQLGCALQLKDYKVASEAATMCSRKWKSGNQNWFVFMESLFLLRMHEGDYAAAMKIFNEATEHPRYTIVDEHRHQRWTLYGCYLEYAQGKFKDAALATKRLNALRRMPMLTTKYGKDKAGFNLAIRVLEFLILLDRKKFVALEKKIESFGRYKQRYLQPDPEGEAFVGFLIAMARDLANKSVIDEVLMKLKKAALEGDRERKKKISLNAESLVVIPYEKLVANTLTSFQLDGILHTVNSKTGSRTPSKKTSRRPVVHSLHRT